MARTIARGDIWMLKLRPPDKRRRVVVITRSDAIGVLHTVMVAPVSSTLRGAPSEVVLGIDDGLEHDSTVSLDHIQTVEQARLESYVGSVRPEKLRAICRALSIATGCDASAQP